MKDINFFLIFVIGITLTLCGCTSNIQNLSNDVDPFENINRKIFVFNKHLDEELVLPASEAYRKNIPKKVRKKISNHLEWMQLPSTIINSSIQIDVENTVSSTIKFMLNGLTLGFFELDGEETEVDKKDFGSTLAKYNFPEGPFLMIPFFGPRFTRDVSGLIVDRHYLNNILPSDVENINLVELPINIIDKREELSKGIDIIYNSPDPYIKMRSYYTQNRRNKVYSDKYIEVKNRDKDEEFEKLLQ